LRHEEKLFMSTRIAVVGLWAEDMAAAVHFYRDVIGLRTVKQRHKRPHFDLGGVRLVLLEGRPTAAQNAVPLRFPLVAFAVDDLEAALVRLQEAGIRTPWGVGHDAHSKWVMFHDPAGNLIELVQEEATAGL
jgi:catechol 2,3-dioxygenase-like lactoylglutathione lyase family enzyme